MVAIVGLFGTEALAADEAPPPSGTIEGRFGKGVTLRTPDDSLSLTIRGRVQTRASLLAFPDDPETPEADGELLSELVIRRARVTLAGHALQKNLTYYLQLAFSNQDTESDLRLPLRDAYLNWAAVRELELRVGQQKVPFGRQRVTSSGSLQFVDRSIVVAELNLDRDVGVVALSKDVGGLDGRLGYAVGLFGGDGRNRLAENFGYLASARFYVRPMGEFDDNVEADLDRRDSPKLAIGGGVAYNMATNRPRSTISEPYEFATFDYLHAGADAAFKWHGFSLTGEWMMRQATEDEATDDTLGLTEYSRSASGWYAQAGQLVGPHFEVVARYGSLTPFDGTDPELLVASEMGGGVNWYFEGHDLKLQNDVFWLAGEDLSLGTTQVRSQLQLWF